MISLITGTYTTVTPIINHAKTFLVVLWTEGATDKFTRNISLKFHYSRTLWIPLKLCFLIFPLTWYGCYANQKKVMGFRGGTQTFPSQEAKFKLAIFYFYCIVGTTSSQNKKYMCKNNFYKKN